MCIVGMFADCAIILYVLLFKIDAEIISSYFNLIKNVTITLFP